MKSTPTIVIFGIGAMGTLFGSRLNEVAHVALFGNWPEQIDTLRREGLTIIQLDGRETQHALQVTNDLNQLPPADIVLILVKSHQTTRAALQAAKILRPGGVAITLQNGLGNLEKLASAVGQHRAALGITAQGATTLAPGRLRHAGQGPTHLALAPGLEPQLQLVSDLFNQAGLETTLMDNANSLVWGKLAINAGINPLTALLEIPNGKLVEEESLRQIMSAATNEVVKVAAAQGIHLPFADAAQRVAEVSQATAGNRSSMLQDISRAAPTEIDAISGAVVRFGRLLGIPTPVNEFLLGLIKDKEAGRLTMNLGALNQLALPQSEGVV
jgi:2-dehydropantoate 2-reductase